MTKFFFVDTNEKLVSAWQQVFGDIPEISISHGSIFDYPADAIVSPANSFGYMNGGIDFTISKNLGWHIEKELQQIIREKHFGELLVGQAVILPTQHPNFPYLISAPYHAYPHNYSSDSQYLFGNESYFSTIAIW